MISIHSFASPPLGIQFTKNGSMIKRLRKKCVSYVEFDFRSFIICEIVAVTKSLTIFFLKIYFSPILINEHEICLYIKLFVSKAQKNVYLLKPLVCNPFKNSNTARNRIGVSYSTLPNLMFLAETPQHTKIFRDDASWG